VSPSLECEGFDCLCRAPSSFVFVFVFVSSVPRHVTGVQMAWRFECGQSTCERSGQNPDRIGTHRDGDSPVVS
jgi:hypothetical protein